MQPISAIGKGQAGYTLLEILAVLILMGFIGTLAFPAFFRNEEKLAIGKIEDTIRNDWEKLQREAMAGKMNHTVTFDGYGYSFEIGEAEIRRSFQNYNFTWTIPEQGEETESNATVTRSGANLTFNPDGSCSAGEWGWETLRFRGVMRINDDGTMEWRYERK